jgi:phosphoheptose isomerase
VLHNSISTTESTNTMTSNLEQSCEGLIRLLSAVNTQVLERFATEIAKCGKRRGIVYVFGNGGSAAIAEHFALDLNRIADLKSGDTALRARCLVESPVRLTADANDFGFDHVFSKQIDSYVTEQDIAIAISASGASPNVVAGLKAAREHRATTMGLTRTSGTPTAQLSDICVEIPSEAPAMLETVFACALYMVSEQLRMPRARRLSE